MVVERSPAKFDPPAIRPEERNALERPIARQEESAATPAAFAPLPQPAQQASHVSQPIFGQPPPLQRPPQTNIFNVPKPNRPRPEFHRPLNGQTLGPRAAFRTDTDPRPQQPLPDVFEIPRPAGVPFWEPQPVARPPLFSTKPAPVSRPIPRVDVDLTNTAFDYNQYEYVDVSKANADIKALLEGAFEDESDKPRTRRRKKQLDETTDKLADSLAGMNVGSNSDNKVQDEESDEDEDEDEDEDDGAVEGLKVKLLPHQIDGVEWMREKELGKTKVKGGSFPKGGILADDMGLGKTIQSIALLLTNPRPPLHTFTNGKEDKGKLSNNVGKATLVVAPLALIKQWESEISTKVEHSHKLRVLVHHGPQRTKRAEDLRRYDVVITTYQTLVSEYGNSEESPNGLQVGCFGVNWYRVMLDEAHSIKNRNAKASQACCALHSEYRWCLTGTPMQNNLDEIQSLIKFLRVKPYNDLSIWKAQITKPLNAGRGKLAMGRLQAYLRTFMKRRTKDVLKQEGALNFGKTEKSKPGQGFKIMERRVKKLEIDFTPRERQFYDRLEARTDKSIERMMGEANMSYASALTLLLRLRQACNHAQLITKGQDQDAQSLEQQGTESPKKKQATAVDVDDIATALGGLSVKTKQCDICQIELSDQEVEARMIRCTACQEDLDESVLVKPAGGESRKQIKHRGDSQSSKHRKERNRRVVEDSDEEEEDGDWIVPKHQRTSIHLDTAGGSEDENGEGGGEWIGTDDTDTGEEDSVQILGSHHKEVISLDTSEEEPPSSDERSVDDFDKKNDSSTGSLESDSETASNLVISAKITKLLEILRKESHEHKFIVFSVFTSMLDIIEPFLRNAGITFTRYDGSMRNDHREASLERLRNDKQVRVMLCSLKCGSLGLNLTAASRVVILEPFWNPFVEEQAIDRVHRLNQTVDVNVYKLTISHTVESRIFDLQEKKRALAEAAVEGKAVAKLSMQDLLNLFKHDDHHRPSDPAEADFALKPSVLHALGKQSAPSQEQQRVTSGQRQGAVHVSKSRPPEHAVYGRRW